MWGDGRLRPPHTAGRERPLPSTPTSPLIAPSLSVSGCISLLALGRAKAADARPSRHLHCHRPPCQALQSAAQPEMTSTSSSLYASSDCEVTYDIDALRRSRMATPFDSIVHPGGLAQQAPISACSEVSSQVDQIVLLRARLASGLLNRRPPASYNIPGPGFKPRPGHRVQSRVPITTCYLLFADASEEASLRCLSLSW